MAEGNFNLFHSGFLSMFGLGPNLNVSANPIVMSLLKNSHTPDISMSTSPSINADLQTLGKAGATFKTLVSVVVEASATGNWKFDAADIIFTASSGFNLTAQYALVWQRSVSGGFVPLFLSQLSTGAIVASQITVQFAAEGLFDYSASATIV